MVSMEMHFFFFFFFLSRKILNFLHACQKKKKKKKKCVNKETRVHLAETCANSAHVSGKKQTTKLRPNVTFPQLLGF